MRVPNWDVAIVEWASEQSGRPFIWGETDCVSLVIAGLSLVSGRPFYQRPDYDSKESAQKLVPFNGRMGKQLALLGEQVLVTMAQSADVIVIPADEDAGEFCDGLGIVVATNQVLVTNPEHGVRIVPLGVIRRVTPIEVYRMADAQ